MSYDVSLYAGEDELASRHMMSYVSSSMWRHAGVDLAEFHGKKAGSLIPVLEHGIEAMTRYPITDRRMRDLCFDFLCGLIKDFEQYPYAIVHVRVWR